MIKEEKNQNSKTHNGDEIENIEVVNQLKELKDLHDKGIIDDEEFKKAKQKVLE